MTYSHEVEMMCPVTQGVHHGAAPIPEEAKWVKAKEIRIHSRYWLVRTAAGYLQTDSERKRGRYPGSSR